MSKQLLHGCLYLLCTLSLFVSCKKNPDANSNVFPGSSFPIPASTPVQGTLSGRVVDENNAPVASAVVECAGISVVSNADGFFNINNATLDKYVSTVIVSKAGYFKGYRSFSASPTRNFVSIKLIPRILSGTFDGTSGGIITLSNGTKIDFLPNGMIIKSSGAVYNGTVNVFAAYIDPTSDDISSKVPGSFMGRDGTNLYSLQSAGMLAVDIESVSGEVLQLAANKPASVKLPIPNSIVGKAPSNIDTWSLDEQGVWKKEAIAVKSGDHYEFSATHFSFWNVDVPNNAVYLSLHLQDNSGHSLVNTSVSLTISPNNSWPSTTYGITDELGNVSGMVPAGYELQLQIFPGMNVYACTTPLYSQGLGMFTENTSLTVTATLSSQQFQENIITVTGIANDCSGLPLQSGTVFIQSGNHYTYASVTNGSYSTLLAHCDAVPSITISISDNNTTAIAAPVIVTTTGNTAVVPLVTLTCGLTLNPLDGIYEISGSFVDAS
ncbi:MAG: carboxypeptidase-like regulatory domain-containing protein, partial [Ferruginibacter sp.]